MTATTKVRLSLKEKISYGLGDFGNGFMFDLGQAYLLKFYTDVAGLPGTTAGGVFLFTKIFDAFMDPIAGSFVDGRKKIGRYGRFRPVMMYSSVILAALTVFTFLTPGGTDGVNLFYAYASYMAWGVLYSFTNVPYGSLGSVMTAQSGERAKLASFRQAGSVGALLVTGVAFLPIAHAFANDRIGYAVAAGVLSLCGVLAFYGAFRGTKERVNPVRQHVKLTPGEFVRTITTNRPLLVLILMTLFSISAYNLKTAMVIYFTQYYLGDASVLPYVNFIAIGASIIGIVSMPTLVARFGKKRTAIGGFLLAAAADGLNFVLPSNTVIFTVLLAISFIGVAIPNGIVWAMVSDVIDFGHWRTGRRREGITYSMFNFSRKIGQSIAGGFAGFGLSMVGYVANTTQSSGTLFGIKALQTLYPCIAFLLAAGVLLFLYKLTDARHAQLIAEITERDPAESFVEQADLATSGGPVNTAAEYEPAESGSVAAVTAAVAVRPPSRGES
jgi:GPH family glycoside/pentoside/hexuronide:cation symporter